MISNNVVCATSSLRSACAYSQSDLSLCLSLDYFMIVKLLTEQHSEFLSLTGGCTGSSESTLIKIPHCWKSHVVAQLLLYRIVHQNTKGSSPPLLTFFRTRGDFNFDDAVSNRFGCEVHSFDPGYVNKDFALLTFSINSLPVLEGDQ